MTPSSSSDTPRDKPNRIRQLVGDFVRQISNGESIDGASIAAEHPDLLPELADALSDAQRRMQPPRVELPQTLGADVLANLPSGEDASPERPIDAAGTLDHQEGTVDVENTVLFDRKADPGDRVHAAPEILRGPDFQLLKVHAEGGLGRVWLAHDRHLNRDVALKELHSKSDGDERSQQTFLKEAQVTAQLEHPNIVPVYQLGLSPSDGAPFYTMRMIQGETLSQRIAQYHQGENTIADRALMRRRLLTALIDLCNAVAYAHDRGVVHRDLKPLNVVLGKFGEVILLDWGLAKLIHQRDEAPQPQAVDSASQATTESVSLSHSSNAQATVAGSVLGTPAYMAPEQATGDVDAIGPLTDVYGLGAILFEILTGTAPHRGKNVLETLEGIVSKPVPRARAVKSSVPPGLHAVCAKAIAKKPQDRYRSATELADDIERWLADQPVSVYRDPPHVRFLRWARHHKALVSAASVLVLTALIAFASTTVLVRREQQQTEAEFLRADRNYRRALAAVDEMLTEVGQEDLAHVPQMEIAQRRLLERALAFYRSFLDEKPDDPQLRLETARAYHRVADILRMLGEHAEAQTEYENAIAISTDLVREFPDHLQYRQQLAQSHNYVGELHRRRGELDVAEREYTRAATILRELVRASNAPDYQQELARAHYNLGLVHLESGRVESAEKAFDEASEILNRLVNASTQVEYRQELARVRINLGSLMSSSGRSSEAEEEYGEAIELLQGLLVHTPTDRNYRRELAAAYNNLGNLLLPNADRRPAARDAIDSGLKLLEELARDYPSVPLYQQELGNSLNSVGGLHFFVGDKGQAKEDWTRARELFARLSAEYPAVPEFKSKLGATEGNLGWLAMEEEELVEAKQLLNEAIRHQSSALQTNPNSPTYRGFLANHYRSLSETLLRQGDHAAAAKSALLLEESSGEDWHTALRAAALSARCVELVQRDTSLSDDQRIQLAGEYTMQTVALLQSAHSNGLRDSNAITSNKAFDAVRDAESFAELLEQIETAGNE